MPTFAPTDKELGGVLGFAREGFGVVEAGVVEAVGCEDVVDEAIEVGVGVFVDTTAPRPFNTIPRCSLQHGGSLSQQKLPSVHLTARGRNPVPGSAEGQHSSFAAVGGIGYHIGICLHKFHPMERWNK